jgi:hypothetical protein
MPFIFIESICEIWEKKDKLGNFTMQPMRQETTDIGMIFGLRGVDTWHHHDPEDLELTKSADGWPDGCRSRTILLKFREFPENSLFK